MNAYPKIDLDDNKQVAIACRNQMIAKIAIAIALLFLIAIGSVSTFAHWKVDRYRDYITEEYNLSREWDEVTLIEYHYTPSYWGDEPSKSAWVQNRFGASYFNHEVRPGTRADITDDEMSAFIELKENDINSFIVFVAVAFAYLVAICYMAAKNNNDELHAIVLFYTIAWPITAFLCNWTYATTPWCIILLNALTTPAVIIVLSFFAFCEKVHNAK